ncbi:MAG: phosphatase PAP2 family protein [Flammeovirgaceae bacterium]|nr:phosphatase PAP2 family protein [Flammeovirgaceae bacterium]
MEAIIELDKKLLLFLNSFHADWLDPIILYVTKTFFWLPLYLFLLYLVIKNYKKYSWIPLLGIALTITMTDRITSGFMKPYFKRLRPSQDPDLEGLVRLVDNYKGGLYGFASSHAANTFATAIFFFLLFRNNYKWMWLLFVWAIGMTYTRIYLGVHYPGDILVGGMLGMLCGWIGFTISNKLDLKFRLRSS